jgi:lysophospholipase L1-like esterase
LEDGVRRSRLLTFIVGLPTAVGAALLSLGAAPAQAAPTVNYVALGDSYSSGVGAGAYTSESGPCYRSSNAYPALWAAANSPASFVSAACNEATTTDVLNTQLGALSPSTTLVSITIGGNDVEVAGVMRTCIFLGTNACVGAVQAAEDRARTALPGALNSVYNAISERAPQARVIVLGYPTAYQLGWCWPALSETSRAKLNELTNVIDDVISNVGRQHGFTFADPRSAFIGHQLCGNDAWLHGVNLFNLRESYHPTAAGHARGYFPVFKAATG